MENTESKKKDYADLIIKVVLVMIIIALLIHNCTLMNKEHDKLDPSGNVNIIEIKCDKSCIKKKTNTDDEPGKDIDNKEDNTSDKSSGDNNNNTNTDTNTNTNNDEEEEEEPIDYDSLEVYDEDYDTISWNGTTNLNIFSNSIYTVDGVIAPESSNTYQFVVKNSTEYTLKYKIDFTETNPMGINMKFKLKKNDTYVVDHYVSYDELNIDNQLLSVDKNDTFYLEWKWISSSNDTNIGKSGANYQLKIEVSAEGINE